MQSGKTVALSLIGGEFGERTLNGLLESNDASPRGETAARLAHLEDSWHGSRRSTRPPNPSDY